MSRDLERLLHDTAVRPQGQPDFAELVKWGRRRRRTRHAGLGGATAVAVLVGALAVVGPTGPPSPPEIVDQPSPTLAPESEPAEPDETVEAVPAAREVVDHAAGGSAVTGGFGSVWVAGPYRYETGADGREWAEILRASLDGQSVEAVIEVPVPMRHLLTAGGSVWAVSVADGAQPQNLLVRIDPDTNEVVDQLDLGDFSTAGIAATSTGELLLVQGNGHPGRALWARPADDGSWGPEDGSWLREIELPGLQSPSAVATHDGTVAIADGRANAILVATEETLRADGGTVTGGFVEHTGPPTAIGFAADALWVASNVGQHVINVGPEATSTGPYRFNLDSRPVALLTHPVVEGFFVVSRDGTVSYGKVERDRAALVSQGPSDVTAAGWVGTYIWIVGHDDIRIVSLEDEGDTTTGATAPDEGWGTPSQTADEAERDGVLAEVAALPFDARVNEVDDWGGATTRVETSEGVWVASRLDPNLAERFAMPELTDSPVLGDPTGVYGRDFINVHEYGEVLLLDASETRIVRAFPLPGLPPAALAATDRAVYCGRQGDGALSTSMLCRIDRETLQWRVRVFPHEMDSPFHPEPAVHVPDHWAVAEPVGEALWGPLVPTGDRLISIGYTRLAAFDPMTLELITGDVTDAAHVFGSIRGVDPEVPNVTFDPAQWLTGDDADAAYEQETGDSDGAPNDYYIRDPDDDTVAYPVGEGVEVRMSLLWDYDSGPEDHSKPITWEEFARIWSVDATSTFPQHEVDQARQAYYWLLVVDGEVVRIDQQYRP